MKRLNALLAVVVIGCYRPPVESKSPAPPPVERAAPAAVSSPDAQAARATHFDADKGQAWLGNPIQLQLQGAEVGYIDFTGTRYFIIGLVIGNKSPTRRIHFDGFNGLVTLEDDLGNDYQQVISLTPIQKPGLLVRAFGQGDFLDPSQAYGDFIVFEPPVPQAKKFFLHFDLRGFGQTSEVCFEFSKEWMNKKNQPVAAEAAPSKLTPKEPVAAAVHPPRLERREKPPEPKRKNRPVVESPMPPRIETTPEQDAMRKLKLAKEFAYSHQPDKYRDRLEEIVQKYPGTPAAKEAQALLNKIINSDRPPP
jgi:hypothetical protein